MFGRQYIFSSTKNVLQHKLLAPEGLMRTDEIISSHQITKSI